MSNNRFVDLSKYDAHPRVIAWLSANRIDPRSIPAAQTVLVTEEHISFQQWEVDPATGAKHAKFDENGDPYLPRFSRTVPLLSDPETHGVEVYRNV